MLKMTGIELELISHAKMHVRIGKGMRGGIPYMAKRYIRADSKYMTDYKISEESKFIMYANNLYGWSMRIYLPYGGFKWLSQKEIDNFDVNSISENIPIGYISEADLEYPNELRELQNDYPLAPEQLEISNDMLSKYCSDFAKKYGI